MSKEAKVLGIHYLDFKDDAGKPVKGHQIWLSAPTDAQGWQDNIAVMKSWVADGTALEPLARSLLIGDTVEWEYNGRGKPVLIDNLR